MDKSDLVLRTALAGLVALGFAATAGKAGAAENEKCAGIVKAGKNDCATKAHSCAGQAKGDNEQESWVYLPKGTCERIVGGTVVASDKK